MPAMIRRQNVWMLVGYVLLAALAVMAVLLIVTRRPAGLPIQLEAPPTPMPVRVHVTGAVASPGVYRLTPGSIVQDAISAAGGATAVADLSRLNLAHRLLDGEQIIVPAMAPTAGPGTPLVAATQGGAPAGLINVNTASAAELEALPEVGPALAQRIVDYRTEHGPFAAVEDVMEVPGIGPSTFAAIKDLISVY
jgi:competence protein ComEA